MTKLTRSEAMNMSWDIDPPIYHVQQAHKHCVEWIAAIAKEKSE